jgi:protein TonB
LTGSLQGLFTSDDYPPSAQDNNEEGTVSIQLTVGPNGRVVACSPSGGTAALRDATCRIARARARYSPAQDASGNPTTSTTSASITWRLE